MLIPLQATGQDTDHPATSLARMQEAFQVEASKPDYKQMISLMDSMITMETAIDHKVRPRLLKTYSNYALLFGKSLGRGGCTSPVHVHRFPENQDTYGMTLPCQSGCPIVPAAPYQSFFLDRAIVYPCNDIYELALFVLEVTMH